MQDPYPLTQFRSQWLRAREWGHILVAPADDKDAFVALQDQIGQRTLGYKLLQGVDLPVRVGAPL
jgi:hypothetical protein